MVNKISSFILVCGLVLMAVASSAQAQTTHSVVRADALGKIQTAVNRTIGAQVRTVEVTTSGDVVVVTRINSNMNDSTHEGRNNEAKQIASLVARSVGDKTAVGAVSTIRIDYVVRVKPSSAPDKIVDSVEFRKGPDGVFDFHQT
jgi:hypothetical protein